MSRRATFIRIVFGLCSTLFSLLIGEITVRIVAPQGMSPPLVDEIKGITALRPGVRGRLSVPKTFDVTLSINSQRFRSQKDYSPEPPAGVVRIIALGDSFTFGYGANDDETYPAQLERSLCDLFGPGRVEVINAGIGDTGTGEEALLYEVWARQWRPHVVILNVVPNDVDDDRAFGGFYLGRNGSAVPRSDQERMLARRSMRRTRSVANAVPGYMLLAQHSHLLNLVRNVVWARLKGSTEAALLQEAAATSDRYNSKDPAWEEGLRLMAAEVLWLNTQVRDSKARLAVVFLPSRVSIYPSTKAWAAMVRRMSEEMVGVLVDVCSRENIPFLDVTPQVLARSRGNPALLYYKGLDEHPSAAGYQTFAEAVAHFLVQERILNN